MLAFTANFCTRSADQSLFPILEIITKGSCSAFSVQLKNCKNADVEGKKLVEKIQYSLETALRTGSTKSIPLKRAMAIFQIGC